MTIGERIKDNLYFNRHYILPNVGENIKITWLPNFCGCANAYIGMQGIVEDTDITNNSFILNCGTNRLIVHGSFKYKKYK